MVFNAKLDKDVAVGVGSVITGVVGIGNNKYVPPGSVITTQEQARNVVWDMTYLVK